MLDGKQLALLVNAVNFAAQRHKDQTRRDGTTPYINHPIEVMQLLLDVGDVYDVEILAAAVLHDTVEDTETTSDELRAKFGERVAFLVAQCTDDKSLPKSERKRLQVEHAPHMNPDAKLIKICDKTSNMRSLVEHPPLDWTWERCSEYLNWCMRVFQGLEGVNVVLDKAFLAQLAESRRILDERAPGARPHL